MIQMHVQPPCCYMDPHMLDVSSYLADKPIDKKIHIFFNMPSRTVLPVPAQMLGILNFLWYHFISQR